MTTQLHLNITSGSSDCEDCGGYDYAYFDAVFPDGSTLVARYDGHLGGGIWNGNNDVLFLWCLAKLGFLVHHNDEPVEHSAFQEEHSDRGFTEYRAAQLFPENPTIRALRVISLPDPDYPDYEYPARVVVPAFAGCDEVVFETEQGVAALGATVGAIAWDGDFTPIYRLLLEQCVDLVLLETREVDD
jgi:hypothetical protein